MSELWSTLIPLIIGSAFVPIQLIITILLLRSGAGPLAAIAWVAGMSVVRLAQGVVFGLVLGDGSAYGPDGPSIVASTLLLVLAVVFYVTAIRQAVTEEDPDAPPPKYLQMIADISVAKAFVFGMGVMLIGAKFWVFTLGAITAIGEADLTRGEAVATFLAFVLLASSVQLALIAMRIAVPERADTVLGAISDWLTRNNRLLVIAIGLIFGTWFLIKALRGFGVL